MCSVDGYGLKEGLSLSEGKFVASGTTSCRSLSSRVSRKEEEKRDRAMTVKQRPTIALLERADSGLTTQRQTYLPKATNLPSMRTHSCKFNLSFAAAAKLPLVCSKAKLTLRLGTPQNFSRFSF